MGHEIPRAVGFEKVGRFRLAVGFTDGTSQTIDIGPILRGELYGPDSDPEATTR